MFALMCFKMCLSMIMLKKISRGSNFLDIKFNLAPWSRPGNILERPTSTN